MNKYLTIKEVAEILGVSKITLRNWDKSGKLKAHRHPFNNYRVYDKQDIEELLKTIDNGNFLFIPKIKRKNSIKKLQINHLED